MSNLFSLLQLKLTLNYKIAICFSVVFLLGLSSFWFLAKTELHKTLEQQTDALGQTLAAQTAEAVKEVVLSNDLLSLNVVLDQISRNPNIFTVSVYDIDEQLLASSHSDADAIISAQNLSNSSYSAQIIFSDAIAGAIQLQLNTSVVEAGFSNSQLYFWGILTLGLAFAIALAFAMASHISNPLFSIIHAIQNPDEKILNEEKQRSDEIGLLQNASVDLITQYQQELSEKQSLSGLNDSDKNQQSSKQPLKIMASILIIKVVNINTAIELLHPSTLSRLLNEYLFYLKQAAKLYGGNVHRFAGDSVMVSFDPRESGDNYSFNAVCCAQLFLMLMDKIAQRHRAEASQALEFRLAIHSGETFITLTTNDEEKIENEALIGKVIETSYFLSKHSKPSQLIISETTYKQAGGETALASEGSIEITMPSDNVSFMAYILDSNTVDHTDLLAKQCQHLVPD